MRYVSLLSLMLVSLPLVSQTWDLRVEAPFAKGQDLHSTFVTTAGQLRDHGLDTSDGLIFSVNHRIVRVNPVLRLDWTVEYSQLGADGDVALGGTVHDTRLKQRGLGAGLNAQFWVPFTGLAGEVGVIQRFHRYDYRAAGERQVEHLSRTWLRVGARWRLPLPVASPYIAASYQWPLGENKPQGRNATPDVATYLAAQGAGQEFEKMWTVGVGVQF